jgi:tetratricopeptide (TPR) repeat protein
MTEATNPPPTPEEGALSAAQLAAQGRFSLALRTLRLQGGDEESEAALLGLADVEVALRERRPRRARQAFGATPRAASLPLPWETLATDVEAIATAQEAIDGLELDQARNALAALSGDFFAAERLALIGTIAVREGDAATALTHLEAALALDPNHVRALTNRGSIRLEAGELALAVADYERAIAIDPSFANAHHNLGVAYRRQGAIAKSVASLRKAQRLATQRDAEDLRTPRKGARSASGGGGGTPWRRYLSIAAVVAVVWWFMQGRG